MILFPIISHLIKILFEKYIESMKIKSAGREHMQHLTGENNRNKKRCGSKSECGGINIFRRVFSGTAEMQMDWELESPRRLNAGRQPG